MAMQDSDKLDLGKDANLFLFKGDPTTRKTANAGSFGEPGKPFGVADIDGKVGSIKVAHPDKKFQYDYFSPTEYVRLTDYIESIVDRNPFQGGTFVFDSFTSFVKMSIGYAISMRSGKRGKDEPQVGDTDIAGWPEYNFETAVLDNMMACLRELSKSCKVIVTGHVIGTEVKVEDGAKVIYRPIFTAGKKPAIFLPGQFKEIYHFYQEKTASGVAKYIAVTQSTDVDYASTMLGLPKVIDVTDCKLYDKIKAHCEQKGWTF